MKKTAILFLCLLSLQAFSQVDEEPNIRKTVNNLLTGMQTADTTAIRKCFYEDARLQTALFNVKTGKTKLLNQSVDSFLLKLSGMNRDTLLIEERIIFWHIKIDDPLVTVWAPYEFYANGRLSHTGVDAFQLFKTEEGWKIIQLCDTRKRK